jgi:hypothetical protein
MSAAFSRLPSYLSLLLAIVLSNGAAFVMFAAVRAYARHVRIGPGTPVVGAWATATASLCSLLFAFVVVTLWGIDTRATSNADAEATAARMIARDVLPTEVVLDRDYLRAAIDEWPALCGGGNFSLGDAAFEALLRNSHAKKPSYDDDLQNQLSALETLRAERLNAAQSSVPSELWFALVVLSLAVLAVLSFVLMEETAYQLPLMIVFAVAVGVLFWVTGLLDYPYCGGTSVSPQPLIDTLRHIS